ncbi:U3 snoRNP protein [Entophlyctis sp. JEL0112]|nr:U3 snoRNP protein [Entophlyctis sp. JEL0112]
MVVRSQPALPADSDVESATDKDSIDSDIPSSPAAEQDDPFVGPISSLFEANILSKPDIFLVPDANVSEKLLAATKWMFDLGERCVDWIALEVITHSIRHKATHTEPFEMSPLPALLTEGFEIDQIWEQIQLRNRPMLKHLSAAVSSVLVKGDVSPAKDEMDTESENASISEQDSEDDMFSNEEVSDNDEEPVENDDSDSEELADGNDALDIDEENIDDQFSDVESEQDGGADEIVRETEVDDEFFLLREMEKFAERGEARDIKLAEGNGDPNQDDDDWNLGVDLLNMDPDDLEGSGDELNANDIRYEDFFAPPRRREAPKTRKPKIAFNETIDEREFDKDAPVTSTTAEVNENSGDAKDLFEDSDDDSSGAGPKRPITEFEREQQLLEEEIATLEAEAIAEKSWTLSGEVSSKKRPVNSLLEEDLEVEHASRPAPVVTEETTRSLEDLIKSRIADALFDDVERKIPPKTKKFDPNRRNIIDEEKSSKSLAEIYEDDYRKKTAGDEKMKTEKDAQVENAHREIDGLFKDLCNQLDALSNWHYTARAPVAELEVVPGPSVPALTIEEVIPAVVSDAALAAPKEVYAGNVGKSEAEMERADKRKARNKQKRAFKKQKLEREKELKATGASADNVVESAKKGKERAMDVLMKQKNVTIIGDSKTGKGSAAAIATARKSGGKRGKAVKATVVPQSGDLKSAAKRTGPVAHMLKL